MPLEYTISSADTWEKKILTVPARTSGTWATSGASKLMGIRFTMGKTGSAYAGGTAGSWSDDSGYAKLNSNNQSSFADWYRTANSEFYLTGVQYEIGEQASEFQHRPFGEELLLCQRYYEICNVGNFAYHYNDQVSSNDQTYGTVNYKVNKPFNPTLTTLTGTVTSYQNPYTYGVSPRYVGNFNNGLFATFSARIRL